MCISPEKMLEQRLTRLAEASDILNLDELAAPCGSADDFAPSGEQPLKCGDDEELSETGFERQETGEPTDDLVEHDQSSFMDSFYERRDEVSAPFPSLVIASRDYAEFLDDSDDEDPNAWMVRPWDWLSDSELEDEDLRDFGDEVKESFNVSMVQRGVVDLQLLDLVGSRLPAGRPGVKPTTGTGDGGDGAGAASSAAVAVHPPPPRSPWSPRHFVRRRCAERRQETSSTLSSAKAIAGSIARSLRRAGSQSLSSTSKRPLSNRLDGDE